MKKNDIFNALVLLIQCITTAFAVVMIVAFVATMCSCSVQKNISSKEYSEEYFYYDEILHYDADRNVILYYWECPYEISLEDVLIEDIADSDFVIINNKLEYELRKR